MSVCAETAEDECENWSRKETRHQAISCSSSAANLLATTLAQVQACRRCVRQHMAADRLLGIGNKHAGWIGAHLVRDEHTDLVKWR